MHALQSHQGVTTASSIPTFQIYTCTFTYCRNPVLCVSVVSATGRDGSVGIEDVDHIGDAVEVRKTNLIGHKAEEITLLHV